MELFTSREIMKLTFEMSIIPIRVYTLKESKVTNIIRETWYVKMIDVLFPIAKHLYHKDAQLYQVAKNTFLQC